MDPARLLYQQEVTPALINRFEYKNAMQVPRLEKISLNIGVGEAIQTPKLLEDAVEELSLIAGQRAVITQAKRSVSNFKLDKVCRLDAALRCAGIGCMVFSISLPTLLYRRSVISVGYLRTLLMVEVIILWDFGNRLYSQKLSMIKSMT